jgi:hypothetical protein
VDCTDVDVAVCMMMWPSDSMTYGSINDMLEVTWPNDRLTCGGEVAYKADCAG